MARECTLQLGINITSVLSEVNSALLETGNSNSNLGLSFSGSLSTGTGVNNCDRRYTNSVDIASGTPLDLDFAGSLTDGLGQTVVFARIKLIFIWNTSTTAASILTVGADGGAPLANFLGDAASDTVKVGPGGVFLNYNPSATAFAVTATTADVLQISCASGTATTKIVIVGCSA